MNPKNLPAKENILNIILSIFMVPALFVVCTFVLPVGHSFAPILFETVQFCKEIWLPLAFLITVLLTGLIFLYTQAEPKVVKNERMIRAALGDRVNPTKQPDTTPQQPIPPPVVTNPARLVPIARRRKL